MALITARPEDPRDFRKPPLVEMVLSLQFEPVGGLTTAHVGVLWQRFREQLPLIEEHPPLPPVSEKFRPPSRTQVEVTVEEKPPVPRVWFLNPENTELIQVQADRFIRNWRKMQGIEPYPRYEPIRDKFRGEVAVLEQFLRDEGLGKVAVNQCEVTYVNHIEPCGLWERHGQLERVLRNWTRLPPGAFLPEAEDGGVRLRFVIHGEAGKPVGRLHVALQPVWKKADGSPILALNLTARGAPLEEGIEGAFAFFDLGRRWIVKGFADLTTAEMHRVWERIDG
ncbi:MAG: TIGR04255 family protein [Acidobacteriota bacterium]